MSTRVSGIDNTRFAVRTALIGMLIACSAILALSLGSVAWIAVAHPNYYTTIDVNGVPTLHFVQPMNTQFTIACWVAAVSAAAGAIDAVILRILSHNGYIHNC